ncbi:HAMP domain-containing histidine kinase [Acetobacter musti]|uniref:HAMP domain-containing histidine kinase n=1 Tax=Acetobacter musti TaxID=864732 RepID=UPI0018E9715A|nr:HAMP domain-containing histidine kinase [Acetobacter musti]
MKHKSIDLESEVKRATLPEGLQGFLFPLFEAVSNSFHSMEERWGEEVEEKGRIEIEFAVDGQEILIADNGVGFDEKNLGAFLTPLTGNKYERGGKGFGRFIAFKIFREVFYSSQQIGLDGGLSGGSFRYDPFAIDDNLIAISPNIGPGAHRFDTGLTVLLRSPQLESTSFFNLEKNFSSKEDIQEELSSELLSHFLIEFIQRKVPKNFFFGNSGSVT